MRELITSSEQFTHENRYICTDVVFREDEQYYIAQSQVRMIKLDTPDFDVNSLPNTLRIPIETQLLPVPEDLASPPLVAPDPVPPGSHVKRINLLRYSADSREPLGAPLIREMRIYEGLRAHPHPNLCEYRGYIPDTNGHVAGLCFKEYTVPLYRAVWTKMPFDVDKAMSDWRSAVLHLHQLGWIHNDISSGNLMLYKDPEGLASNSFAGVVVDLGECTKKGQAIQAETPWFSRGSKIAEEENDLYGLKQVEKFIQDGGRMEGFN